MRDFFDWKDFSWWAGYRAGLVKDGFADKSPSGPSSADIMLALAKKANSTGTLYSLRRAGALRGAR